MTIDCLSGKPIGQRWWTPGCECDWCRRYKGKFEPREITINDILLIVRRHDNCRGNILGAMVSYEGSPQAMQYLRESGFTEDEIKVGKKALDHAFSFVEKLKAQGYKWDPLKKMPIVIK